MMTAKTLRAVVFLFLSIMYISYVYSMILHDDGFVNATKKNGFGCICHGSNTATDSIHVWIEGPSLLEKNTSAAYTLFMTNGPATAGGYNVAAGGGTLDPGDTTSQLLASVDGLELTHTLPKNFRNDTVQWSFLYHAPSSSRLDTLFSVANSVNGDSQPTGDEYNFGNNFIIAIVDTPVVVQEDLIASSFHLMQNYPNPFNPSTEIMFDIPVTSHVALRIYDLLGNTMAELIDRTLAPGNHHIRWEPKNMPSGIYYYRLSAGSLAVTKKMVFTK